MPYEVAYHWNIIDAVRVVDRQRVTIKFIRNNFQEIEIAQALTTPALLDDPTNHCVHVLDVFPDTLEENGYLMVMPYLRPFNSPTFGAVGEVVDFVKQTLEACINVPFDEFGYILTGRNSRDCAAANIMMDGSALYPEGHHPVRRDFSVDAVWPLNPLARLDNPVKYYFIDFGISTQFRQGESTLVTGWKGRDKELPELSMETPYDPFKGDIFILGNLYKKEILEKYHGVDFLWPLVTAMTKEKPNSRPNAQFALTFFTVLLENNVVRNMRWRIRPRDESIPERVVYDTVAMARETLHQLKRIVGSDRSA
ncbi:hypothetical protein EWM64_g6995 [Hericium alpestre]|uniref:Protein kinase domain-containing protein n=1 Tax=Hericium alpestre TaxID=135208 RepID=A0A4Y9ZU37_9AGAM|nr:hypothetical protein EWM64_g6995 [Hericium alpestre]